MGRRSIGHLKPISNRSLTTLFFVLVILSLTDLVATIFWLSAGLAEEANPMARIENPRMNERRMVYLTCSKRLIIKKNGRAAGLRTGNSIECGLQEGFDTGRVRGRRRHLDRRADEDEAQGDCRGETGLGFRGMGVETHGKINL